MVDNSFIGDTVASVTLIGRRYSCTRREAPPIKDNLQTRRHTKAINV